MKDLSEFLTLNYVDENFEKAVAKLIPKKAKRTIHRNQIMRYGSNYPYNNSIISKTIPNLFKDLQGKLEFDSVTINEYLEDQMINWHTDLGINDIFVISLLSDAKMEFRLLNKKVVVEECSLILPRFSLFTMTGEYREVWEHYVKVDTKRISVVLRQS